jgi:hypothetical protein
LLNPKDILFDLLCTYTGNSPTAIKIGRRVVALHETIIVCEQEERNVAGLTHHWTGHFRNITLHVVAITLICCSVTGERLCEWFHLLSHYGVAYRCSGFPIVLEASLPERLTSIYDHLDFMIQYDESIRLISAFSFVLATPSSASIALLYQRKRSHQRHILVV